jgi:hypothetical protein
MARRCTYYCPECNTEYDSEYKFIGLDLSHGAYELIRDKYDGVHGTFDLVDDRVCSIQCAIRLLDKFKDYYRMYPDGKG